MILSAAVPAWAAAPDAPQPPQAFEPPAQTVTARAHLIFKAAAEPPVVGDVTVIEQGGDFAMVRTSFTTAALGRDHPGRRALPASQGQGGGEEDRGLGAAPPSSSFRKMDAELAAASLRRLTGPSYAGPTPSNGQAQG